MPDGILLFGDENTECVQTNTPPPQCPYVEFKMCNHDRPEGHICNLCLMGMIVSELRAHNTTEWDVK